MQEGRVMSPSTTTEVLIKNKKSKVEASNNTTLSHLVFKLKLNAHSMCVQESSLHTYHTENRYIITIVTIYNIFIE
jgi:hypothetical protein